MMKPIIKWILFVMVTLNLVGCGSIVLINSDGAVLEQAADTAAETDIKKMEDRSRVSSK